MLLLSLSNIILLYTSVILLSIRMLNGNLTQKQRFKVQQRTLLDYFLGILRTYKSTISQKPLGWLL